MTPDEQRAVDKKARAAFMRITQPSVGEGGWRYYRDARIYWYPEEMRYLKTSGQVEVNKDRPDFMRLLEADHEAE